MSDDLGARNEFLGFLRLRRQTDRIGGRDSGRSYGHLESDVDDWLYSAVDFTDAQTS